MAPHPCLTIPCWSPQLCSQLCRVLSVNPTQLNSLSGPTIFSQTLIHEFLPENETLTLLGLGGGGAGSRVSRMGIEEPEGKSLGISYCCSRNAGVWRPLCPRLLRHGTVCAPSTLSMNIRWAASRARLYARQVLPSQSLWSRGGMQANSLVVCAKCYCR